MTVDHGIRINTGLRLAALVDEPVGVGPHPLVVLLHGFTGWKEEEHLATLARGLAARGIAALRFDAPGSGGSEGTWAANYRLTNYLAAVDDVLGYAQDNLSVDSRRVGVWGHSMGGFVALASAVRYADRFRAVCGSQPSMGKKTSITSDEVERWRSSGWASFENSRFTNIQLPYEFWVDRQQYDALKVVPELRIPVLLIAGRDDDLVTAASVKKIYESAPEPKTYLEFPTDHFYKRDPGQLGEINDVTWKFFVNHLA